MSAGFAVELSDLAGWSDQVARAGADAGVIGSYAANNVADGDFGAILELITGDYEAMIPKFHAVLGEDGSRLTQSSSALATSAREYRETDAKVSQAFGVGKAITDDGRADGFSDTGSATPVPAPSSSGEQLPEVSFGYVLDKVCDAIVWVGGPDPREYVTKWIAGNIEKASMQASAWDHASACLKIVEHNLASGLGSISATWTGPASQRSAASFGRWLTALESQASGMTQMAGHLRDMVQQAVDMAQTVVDIIKTVISLVTAALSNASIPFYGQWKLIKSIKEAITMVNSARKVIMVFWNALHMIKSAIVMIAHSFSVQDLPPAPTAA